MFVQQIPCAGLTSTSDLVANGGMAGLGWNLPVLRRAHRLNAGTALVPAGAVRARVQSLHPAPAGSIRSQVQAAYPIGGYGVSGVGCCGCDKGLGTLGDGTGLFGTGLFSSGFDYSQWGLIDWAALAMGGYVLLSVFSTTKHVAGVTRRKYRAAKKA